MNENFKKLVRWVVIGLALVFLAKTASEGGCSSQISTGSIAPAFQAVDAGGQGTWTLDSFRGTPVALLFFATWCPSCRAELPDVSQAMAQRPGMKVLLLGDEDPRVLRDFLKGRGLVIPAAGLAGGALQAYGVRSLPSVVVVDAQGKVDYSGRGGYATSRALKRLAELSGQDAATGL